MAKTEIENLLNICSGKICKQKARSNSQPAGRDFQEVKCTGTVPIYSLHIEQLITDVDKIEPVHIATSVFIKRIDGIN